MAENRRKLQEGLRAQESRTLANLHRKFTLYRTMVIANPPTLVLTVENVGGNAILGT